MRGVRAAGERSGRLVAERVVGQIFGTRRASHLPVPLRRPNSPASSVPRWGGARRRAARWLSQLAVAATMAWFVASGASANDPRDEAAPPRRDLPASVRMLAITPRAAPPFADAPAVTRSGQRVLDTLARVRGALRTTRYQHVTSVREREGLFAWDCSGMAAWVLARAAPRALSAIARPRPVARDFHRVIAKAPIGRGRGGWQRLAQLADARPGDVFAWVRPSDWPRRNTGHVGFVLAPPVAVPWLEGAWAVRIADATSAAHQDDTRESDPDGGYGEGTLMFLTEPSGRATAYAWYGTYSEAVVMTDIVFGRLVR